MIKYFSLLLLFLLSCKSDNSTGKSSKLYLENGYEYEWHMQTNGATPKKGQVVTLDFEIVDDFKNVLSDSKTAGIRPTIQIPDNPDSKMKRNPLLGIVEVMAAGDSATVYVPVDSLSSPPQEFLQSKIVRYVIKILKIEDPGVYTNRIGAEQAAIERESLAVAKSAFDDYMSGKYEGKIITKNGGVKVAVVNDTNGAKPKFNEKVTVNYYGFLRNGKSFDNSYRVGRPYQFKIGRGGVIQGWDIGIPEVKLGASAILDIPHAMAYGNEGSGDLIPPKSDLIFWVQVENIEK
ncbi:MAG: hypothetical protein HKO66_13815 [Saprospiraceae bacterium]|nr:FKBP-type peptidyl-prolyl cis-trans isomerase [Bacteroidia bacterium]NNE16496.1 hypothetical protein [Saprospiraceae bacterium]NNL93312.1 hypothetical protein [Saprospiraceae bacterium]